MGRKKSENPVKWKPVRIQQEWLDLMRLAGKENPRFGPTIDLTTASEPKTLEFACRVAAWFIRGFFWDEMRPKLDQIVHLERVKIAAQVAAQCGASLEMEEDEFHPDAFPQIWIVKDGKRRMVHTDDPLFPRAAMF